MVDIFTPCAELAEYVGRPLQIVTERCRYAPVELAWRWEEYKTDPLRFYRESDLYLFDLTLYHDMILEPQGMHHWFRDTVGRFGFKRLLDFGAGCGDWSLHALSAGATFSQMVDVDGVMRKYVRHRLLKRGFKWAADSAVVGAAFQVYERAVPVGGATLQDDFDPGARYDAVICMDVFEHMVDPEPTIAKMATMAPYLFCNPDDVRYAPDTWLYPQHISRFDLRGRFEHVDRYLWKSKEFRP